MPKCPECSVNLSDNQIRDLVRELPAESQKSLVGSVYAGLRTTIGRQGGHPFSDKPRCPCGRRTLHTAYLRNFDCCGASGNVDADTIARAARKASRKIKRDAKAST